MMVTQKIFLVVLLVTVTTIVKHCYGQTTAASSTSGSSTIGWNWSKNYATEANDNNRRRYGNKYDNTDNDDDDPDYNPSKSSRSRKSPDELAHMNVYIREPSRDGRREKPKRFRFPAARYDYRRFPLPGPFLNYVPWQPIFADRLTRQTIIFTNGGIYILPPLINFYGKMFSVAELIASGYASLVSSGAPPPPAVNVAPLIQPGAVVGPGIPTINPENGGFNGGVPSGFGQFRFPKPKYPTIIEEELPIIPQNNPVPPYSRPNYYVPPSGPNSNYGGNNPIKPY